MKKQFAEYRWLAGSHGVGGSLWEGPDHLLVIEGRGFIFAYREIYRRLDYKNIQVISMANTSGHIWATVLIALVTIGLSLIWLAVFEHYGLTLGVELLALSPFATLAWLVLHLIRGGSCQCAIQTAVLFLQLKPLKRRKTAAPVLERLHAAVLRHQGDIPVGVGLGTMPASTPVLAPVTAPTPFAAPPVNKPVWQGSLTAQICMASLLVWGLMFAGKIFVSSGVYFIAQAMVATIAAMLCTTVLVQTSGFLLLKRSVRPILWLGLVNVILAGVGCFGLFVATMVEKNIEPPRGRQALIKIGEIIGSVTLADGGYYCLLFIILGLVAALLGALGLPATMRAAASIVPEAAAPQPPPAAPSSAPEPPPSTPSSGPWS